MPEAYTRLLYPTTEGGNPFVGAITHVPVGTTIPPDVAATRLMAAGIETLFNAAVITAIPLEVILPAEAENVARLDPDGTKTDAGVVSVTELLESDIVAPPEPAA